MALIKIATISATIIIFSTELNIKMMANKEMIGSKLIRNDGRVGLEVSSLLSISSVTLNVSFFRKLLFSANFINMRMNKIATMEVTIPIRGAAVNVVPKDVEGTTLCKEGDPGNIVIVNVEVPPNTGIVTNFHDKLSFLKIGLAIGINAKMMTNTLIPPYVSMAEIINKATNALYGFFVPTTDNTLSAIEIVAPLLSIYFANIEPSKKMAKFEAINPASDIIYEFSLPNTDSKIGTSLNSRTT